MILIYLIIYDFYLFSSVSKSMEYLRSLRFVKKNKNCGAAELFNVFWLVDI